MSDFIPRSCCVFFIRNSNNFFICYEESEYRALRKALYGLKLRKQKRVWFCRSRRKNIVAQNFACPLVSNVSCKRECQKKRGLEENKTPLTPCLPPYHNGLYVVAPEEFFLLPHCYSQPSCESSETLDSSKRLILF